MQVIQKCRQFKLGSILTNLKESKKRNKSRGPLPWESEDKFANKTSAKLRKVEETNRGTDCCHCPSFECDVLKRPKRNSYEWVINDKQETCDIFGFKKPKKSVCEQRRYEKCIQKCGDGPECKNLAPGCLKQTKTYPMLDVEQKGPLSGCFRPLSKPEKTK